MNAARRRCLVVTLVGLWLAGCSHDVGVVDAAKRSQGEKVFIFEADTGRRFVTRIVE